jgi:hypothetical protein
MVLTTCRGHIHAFWLIYKRVAAEETYGPHGYTYLGNGEFVGNGVGGASEWRFLFHTELAITQ